MAGKLADYVDAGSTVLSVNLPPVQAHRGPGRRITHLHRNVPGVLAAINTLLAGYGTNIVGQTLATKGQVGYVVLDIAGDLDPAAVDALRAMPEAIRVEVH